MVVNVINVNRDSGISRIANSATAMVIRKIVTHEPVSVFPVKTIQRVIIVINVLSVTMVIHCWAVQLVVGHVDARIALLQAIRMRINVNWIREVMI